MSEDKKIYTQAEKDAVRKEIVNARIALMLNQPFFGNLATRLRLVEASDRIPTAATDGRNLYYNVGFFQTMRSRQIEFVLCHEVLHVIFEHILRGKGHKKQLSNIAADYAANQILVDDHIGERPDIKFFQDDKYRGMAYEEIYQSLLDETNGMDDKLKQLMESGTLLDEHMDLEDLTPEEQARLQDDIREALLSAAQATDPGKIPSGIARLVKDFTEPKMNWREVLRMSIQSCLKTNFSFNRPNRKSQSCGAVLPGLLNDETISVFCSIDTSGSISESQVRDFLSEIRGIMDQYTDFTLDVTTFDTRLYNHVTYSADNADDISEYEIHGGGGTNANCVWEYLRENQIEPKKIIIFTDGYISQGEWGDADYADTLFLIHGSDTIVAPHGETLYYDV